MTVDDDEENNKEVTIEKAYDDYEEFGVAYEPTKNKKKVEPEVKEPEVKEPEEPKETPVIKDNNAKEEVLNNFSSFKSKIETEEVEIVNNVEVVKEEPEEDAIEVTAIEDEPKKEEVPSRSEKKKDSKVDEDFFELIDSMYKERVDE